MGITSFRSLLIAAIIFSNCIPWIASRHHFKHNVNGHRSRHRRQGAGLFLPASYVIPGGEGEGGWGEWGEVSACSRTCGGGVAKQKRICLQINPDGQPLCRGGDTKYFSCQTQDCPDGALDFRSEQCAAYNDKLFKGNRYNWVPYTKSPNPCELNCMPHGERFYFLQQSKVVDGTRCNDESFDVCVDGVCQPVGCDMMLGSNAREDKCRQCRGNGTNCRTMSGLIDSIEFRLGYNDVLLIPQGATNIVVAEVRASSNYLALRSKTNNVYYLNGDYHIDFPRSLMIAGTLWHYERNHQGLAAPDKLKCLGPTTEPLYLSILLQEDNVGIEYEYSVPSALAPPPNQNYNWAHDEYSECNATCGGGYQYRQVTCRSGDDLNVVDENLCDVNLKPATNQSCNMDACAPTWVEGPWGVCSKPCGQGGTRSREVYCEKIITNGVTFRFQSKVADKECFDLLGPKPEVFQECNQNATCPTWFTGPWTHCDKLCGPGKQTRQVICHQRIDGRVEVFEDSACADEKPPSEQQCLLHPCEGVDWVLSEWSGCDSCLSTIRSRTAYCTTKSQVVIDPSFCAYHRTPVLEEPCDNDKKPPCQFLWYASQWSNCSVQCGKGVQTRDVFCGNYDGESVTKVEDEKCDAESKFETKKECEVPVEKCPAKWFAGAWSECTKPCGGGEQNRTVMCLNGGNQSFHCNADLVLVLAQPCNEGPCDKDEILPMDSKSTPAIEDYDYEDCEDEEEYPEESAEAISSERSYHGAHVLIPVKTTLKVPMEDITTDDGSGYSSIADTTISETITTVDGSGYSSLSAEAISKERSYHGAHVLIPDKTTMKVPMKDITTDDGSGYSSIADTTVRSENITTVDGSTYSSLADTTVSEKITTVDGSGYSSLADTTVSEKITTVDESGYSSLADTTVSENITTVDGSTYSSLADTTVSENITTVDGSTYSSLADTTVSETITTVDGSRYSSVGAEAISSERSYHGAHVLIPDKTTMKVPMKDITTDDGSGYSSIADTTVSENITTVDGSTYSSLADTTVSENITTVDGSTYSSLADTTVSENITTVDGSTYSSLADTTVSENIPTVDGSTYSSLADTTVSETATFSDSSESTHETSDSIFESTTDITLAETMFEIEESSIETSDFTGTSESGLTETTETTETMKEDLSESTVTDSTEITKLNTIDTTGTVEEKTSEFSATELPTTYISESSPSESTTELGTTETSESSSTDSSGPSTADTSDFTTNKITEISTTESGSTETTESTSTDTSESSPSVITTESSTTETSEASSTTELGTSEFTESGSTHTTELKTTDTGSSLSESNTESGTTEITEFTTIGSSNSSPSDSSTEPGTTETTESSSTETTESGLNESTEWASTGTSETSPSESTTEQSTTEQSTTETTELSPTSTEPGTTESTEESSSTETTESGTNESTEWASTGTSETIPSESTTEQSTTEQSTTETTELSPTSTEPGTTESTEESSSTETTESGTNESTEWASIGTSETSPSESTTEQSTTELSTTETTELSPTSTEPGTTESTEESGSTETTVSGITETTESGSTETESSSTETTPWIWTSMKPLGPKCKPKKTAKCQKSKFGCCPDNKTRATGPFDEGCPNPETCHDSKFGCCPDGVSPANGPHNKGCEPTPCNQTLYGCCNSDNITAAEGNDQEGCPPPPPACKSSEFGCCEDEETEAKGLGQKGCPQTETTVTEEPTTSTSTSTGSTVSEISVGCENTEFGCCYDNETDASGPNGEGCPCSISEFGCCPDGISTAKGINLEGCIMSCNTSAYGCCPDGETPAHGPENEGCCLQYEFGCCPDNYKAAKGPHLEGCGCKSAHFGCCPDNVTIARGPKNEGCGCQYTQFGCCPDRRTEAQGPEFEGCACHTYQFGCCADGVTAATGPNLQGCVCQYSKYGCCGDEATAAKGPNKEGCDCSNSKFGCCPDGVTEAKGDKFLNCSDVRENKQEACALPSDKGSCGNFSVYWFYDVSYGGCVRFWYGGCEGNGNRFSSQEECEDVCVRPPPKDSCNLPKVKGICDGYNIRWYHDASRKQCSQFVYGGCLGNNNNFDSQALCQERCEPEKTEDQCNLPIEQGSCAGNFARWGYDSQRRRCEQFIWGGCEGNSNRFISEAACKLRCSPPGVPIQACSLPQDAGNCTEKHPAWSFSPTENRCIPFYYTGCGGNENRFDTEQACDDSCPSAYVREMCTLPAVTGECAEYTQRWYYDTKHKRCRQFYYGGCGGNENNFMSEFECENRCMEQSIITTLVPQTQTPVTPAPQPQTDPNRPDFCFEQIDSGPCDQFEEHWAYDSARGVCTRFQYGGCGGTRNNFPSLEYCQYYCAPAQDICQLPMLSGPCDASLMRWFYDATTDSCSQFTYSGCEGNGNRFNSMEECERQCRTGAPATTTTTSTTTTTTTTTTIAPEYIPPGCQVSPTLEECRGAGEVWYLNLQQRACVVHINANSGFLCRNTGVYSSQEACERSCGAFRGLDVCRFQVDPGTCEESIPKVYFDYATSRCLQFTYGGCHGGPNRFSSIEECEQVCRPPAIDPCNQPPEQGDCTAYIYMWHYDASRDECRAFVYGGCKGNDNRFQTQQECENRCKKESTTVGIGLASSSTMPTTTSIRIPNPSTTLSPLYSNELNSRFNEPECRTPSSVEPCGANITVYYYDTRTQACLVGDFGGCRYRNSYRTEEECERRCGAFKGLDVCRATLDPGPCLSAINKYYWDAVSGQCLPFAYGGCHGGPNRFSTAEECEEVCRTTGPEPACLQPVSSGEPGCALSSRRWYYHDVYGECIAFVYSGCGGTANNFPSYESCAVACKRPKPAEPSENEVSCDGYEAECKALQCEYGVQKKRMPGGCERCVCVPVDVDCAPLRRECDTLKCNYGVERTTGDDGCERCRCTEQPCLKTRCAAGERCVITAYRDALTLDVGYSAECRIVNKTGTCPPKTVYSTTEGRCRTECHDDADCIGVGKCCKRGCSQLCLEPASLVQSSPAPLHTTFSPDLPYAPRPSEQREPEVRAREGGKVTLRCFLHGNPPPRITWRYGEITIEGDFGRYRMLSDGALEIVSLYRNDTGVYICVADNGLGVATQEIRLEVLDPVEGPAGISGTPNAVVVGEMGRSLSIRCLAYGYPQPAIYWYRGRNGPMVPYSSSLYEARGNVLQIRKLMPETLGEYICQAYNGHGKPADWAFVVQAHRAEESEELPYMVTRHTERSVAPYQYERQTEPTTARTAEVDIPYSVPVRTRITTDRTRLSAGSEINLPCDVDGFPVPEVHWTKDGVQIQRQPADDRIYVTEARLTITRANTNDSGVYGCHANNGYTSDHSTVQISVEGLYIPASCKDSPYFANCNLIVKSKFCHHKYYSTFCCKSCVEAGQLDPNELELMQADMAWRRK